MGKADTPRQPGDRQVEVNDAGRTVFVLNGPNLAFLGEREPEIYGHATLADVERNCREEAERVGLEVIFRQTDIEHEMITWIHEARTGAAGIVINPAAFTHYSIAILDALKMCDCPIVEVHISNIHRRTEEWRAKSLMTGSVTGTITGLGVNGYVLAVRHIGFLRGQNGGKGSG